MMDRRHAVFAYSVDGVESSGSSSGHMKMQQDLMLGHSVLCLQQYHVEWCGHSMLESGSIVYQELLYKGTISFKNKQQPEDGVSMPRLA